MRILITSRDGQIGWELRHSFPSTYEVVAVGRDQLDLANPDTISSCLQLHQPDVIMNAAGYTAVDRAEEEEERATLINGAAVGILGEEARKLGSVVLHFSTDYVFDGKKSAPYSPEDLPTPINAYGRSKLRGEQALKQSGVSHIIVRTSWVYALRRRNFLVAILRQAAMGRSLRIVDDQIGSPTWCRSIAQGVATIVGTALSGSERNRSFGSYQGTYHLACQGSTTWYHFAQKVFDQMDGLPMPSILPVSTADYGARARRPAYSVLDCQKTEESFGLTIPSWENALAEALDSDNDALELVTAASTGDTE